jgi:hypothetical protein
MQLIVVPDMQAPPADITDRALAILDSLADAPAFLASRLP